MLTKAICPLAFLWIILILGGCAQNKQLVSNPGFTIENPSFTSWTAHDSTSISGMDVRFTVKDLPEDITIDSLFFKGQFAPLVTTSRPDEFVAHFTSSPKKDIIMSSDMSREAHNPKPRLPKKSPMPMDPGDGLVVYTKNGSTHYHKISSLKDKGSDTSTKKPRNQ